MTQSQLAGDRFSKEYISQIEREKTRPTRQTLAWLANRLGVDAAYLETGVSADHRRRAEATLAQAEASIARADVSAGKSLLHMTRESLPESGADDLRARALSLEARCLLIEGDAHQATLHLNRARAIVEGPAFDDIDRARIIFQLAVCRYQLSSIATAIALFNEALRLADGSPIPDDALRSNILGWRSRCFRRQRDFEAAREDVERAIELAEAIQDPRRIADALFNASLIAERTGHLGQARQYAERATTYYEALADHANLARLNNNLGGLHFLLGKNEEAVRYLKHAFETALDADSKEDAARAVSSLAQVHLKTGQLEIAEAQARHALKLLTALDGVADELGSANLVLGRALLEQGRLDEADDAFLAAESAFDGFASVSHQAGAWIARGDVCLRRHDTDAAAQLFRKAAAALHDVRF